MKVVKVKTEWDMETGKLAYDIQCKEGQGYSVHAEYLPPDYSVEVFIVNIPLEDLKDEEVFYEKYKDERPIWRLVHIFLGESVTPSSLKKLARFLKQQIQKKLGSDESLSPSPL